MSQKSYEILFRVIKGNNSRKIYYYARNTAYKMEIVKIVGKLKYKEGNDMWSCEKSHLKMAQFLTVHLCLEDFSSHFFLRWKTSKYVWKKKVLDWKLQKQLIGVFQLWLIKMASLDYVRIKNKLNSFIKRNCYMLFTLKDVSPDLAASTIFSKLDAASGFYQLVVCWQHL